MTPSAGDRLGRYEILDPLGAGGMGEVYRAHDERLDRDVAIKVLQEEVAQDPDRLARFEREARAAAALDHQNILAVHELGEHEGRPFIVTELLEGENLRSVIDSGSPTVRKSIEYAVQVANGLAAAHEKGIAHRDLKPENLFLTSGGTVKILDFGLAKLRPDQVVATETPTATLQTSPGMLVGTVAYMAPEQLKGEPADHRSDIFALGVVLYEMLTGSRPFRGGTAAETAAAILKEDARPVSSVSTNVPPALASVVSQCLEKRPEDRFSSAHDLALALRAADESAVSMPPTPAPAVRRRWPHVLAIVIAAAIALLVVLPPEGLWQRLTGSGVEQPPIRSIALLPLENLTGDPEQDYFVDGLHDELISTLAQISAFDKVIARTSVMGFRDTETPIREIGRLLDVEAVLEGSVRRSGDTVRATLQLIDTRTESHLWADSFERQVTDILALQSEVARTVAGEIRLALTPEEERRLDSTPPVDAEAYEAYLMGMRLATMDVSEESWVKATELFEHAIDRDPEFAPAYVGLSIVLRNTAHTYQAPSELMPRSYAAALAAVELDEDLSDAHACLGRAKCRWQWDWSGAESEFRRALELDPSNEYALRSYGEFRAVIGESEEAVQAYHRAFEVDPLNRSTMASVGWVYFFTRQHDKGIAHLSSTVKIYPEFINARLFLAWNYASAGQYENAALEIERCRGINAAVDSNPFTLITDMWVFSGLGDNERTTEVLNRFLEMSEETYVPPSFLAYGYVFLGDTDRAIAWMEKAYDSRDTHLAFARGLPLYDPIRSDPRFQDILRRMNFPED